MCRLDIASEADNQDMAQEIVLPLGLAPAREANGMLGNILNGFGGKSYILI